MTAGPGTLPGSRRTARPAEAVPWRTPGAALGTGAVFAGAPGQEGTGLRERVIGRLAINWIVP